MGHRVDRCDFIDVLEESAVTHRAVSVELVDGRRFIDEVKDVVTEDGEDWAVFRAHDRVAVSDISDCLRAEPDRQGHAGRTGGRGQPGGEGGGFE
jgi:transcriptional antiterminator Rof (Rho-off)